MKFKILIAEDNFETALLYKMILEPRAHAVYTTSDGEECLKTFKQTHFEYSTLSYGNKQQYNNLGVKAFDLVILDIELPKRNGIDVAKEICVIRPNQRILFLSSNIDKLANSILYMKNNIEAMGKPSTNDEIVAKVEQKGK